MCGKGTSTTTNTTTANPQASAAYQDVVSKAQGVYASNPYQAYTGELVPGLNGGQQAAISNINNQAWNSQAGYNAGSAAIQSGISGLGAVQPYLQAGSQAGAASLGYGSQAAGATAAANGNIAQMGNQGQIANAYGQMGAGAAAMAGQYGDVAKNTLNDAGSYLGAAGNLYNVGSQQAYMNPYQQSVIDATMAQARQNDAIQQAGLDASSIGSGNFGGDRSGIAKSTLYGQQAMANNSTVANLNAANYAQATAARQADATGLTGIAGQKLGQASGFANLGNQALAQSSAYGNLGSLANSTGSLYAAGAGQQLAQANIYGNLSSAANQTGSLYNALGQSQGQTAQAYGSLGTQLGTNAGNAQTSLDAGLSAGLQGYTLWNQNDLAKDQAAYGQYQNAQAYPYQSTGWLSNVIQGIGSQEGSSTASSSPYSYLSQGLGAATSAAGILGTTGAFGSTGWLSSMLADGGRVRPKFADGGYTSTDGLGSAASTPDLNSNPNFSMKGGLFGTANPALAAAPASKPAATGHGLGVLAAKPAAPTSTDTTASSGLGSASASPPGFNGSAPATMSTNGFRNANGDVSQNAWMALMSAGAGMMEGAGKPGLGGIGAGLQQGLATYTGLQNADRNAAVQQQELGLKKGSLAIDQQRADQDAQRLQQQAAIEQRQLDLQTSQIQSEITQRNRSAVSMTPTPYGPGGQPGYYITNSMDPANPQVSFRPANGLGGASAAPVGGLVGSPMPDAGTAPAAPASGGLVGSPAPDAPAAQSMPAAPIQASPVRVPQTSSTAPQAAPQGAPAVKPAVNYADPATAPTLDVPQGYLPPNQARLSGPFANPEVVKKVADQDGTYVAGMREAADKATAAQMRIAEMNEDMKNLPDKGPLAPGQFGTERLNIAKGVQAIGGALGLDTSGLVDPEKSASAQDLSKNTMRLGTEMMAATNGAREAGFILQKSIQNTGGIDNTKAGYQKIVAGYDAANRYIQDKATFFNNYYNRFGNVDGAQAKFNELNPPARYVNQALAAGKAAGGQDAGQSSAPATPAPRNGVLGGGRNMGQSAPAKPAANAVLDQARQAIAAGAPRDAVLQRLKTMNIDAGAL